MEITQCYGQGDSLTTSLHAASTGIFNNSGKKSFRSIALPISLIGYGVFCQANEEMREFDIGIKDVVRRDADFSTRVDNYIQYAPGLSVFAFRAAGIKGSHSLRDETFIYLLSNSIMCVMVQSVKRISKVQRPDGFGTNAFPSGHTATAFTGAEFLMQEYKDVSPSFGIGGYTIAATTGVLRMYNNAHWCRDVLAGAGFGILATRIAYWLEPLLVKKIFRKKQIQSPLISRSVRK